MSDYTGFTHGEVQQAIASKAAATAMNDHAAELAALRDALQEIAKGVLDSENGEDYILKCYRLARTALGYPHDTNQVVSEVPTNPPA